jgi:hypothetical protein
MSQYTFTKSPVALDRLTQEIVTSAIVTALDHCTILGSTLDVFFKDDLSSGDQTILSGIVTAHSGLALPVDATPVDVSSQPAFASKKVGTKKLYTRATGKVFAVTVGTNNLDFLIPFNEMKFNGIHIVNGKVGETVNLKILDTATGTITGVANYLLNQFGFSVNLPDGVFIRESQYDADMIKDLVVRIELTAVEARDFRVNYAIHELKA